MLTPLLIATLLVAATPEEAGGPRTEASGLSYAQPAESWDEGLPLGNGLFGALVWGDGNPLKISLGHTGLWDLRAVPEFHDKDYNWATMRQWEKEGRFDALRRLYEDPYNRPAPTRIPAGRIEISLPTAGFQSAKLDIASAQANVALAGDASVKVWVHATEPVGIISIRGVDRFDPKLIAPKFGGKEKTDNTPAISAGDLANLGYPPPVESSGPLWQAYEQQAYGDFKFAVYLAWKKQADASWRGAWSIATSSDGAQPIDVARARVESALADDGTAMEAVHEQWWNEYWHKGWITLPDAVIEHQWYLDMYKFGAAARAGAPPISLQGPWPADNGKLPPWKGDYHHDLNTELSYWPAYTGARLADAQGFVDWLWETKPNCEGWTRAFYGMPGLNVPMTADLLNNQIGGWRQYTHSATTGAWLAQHFYLQYRYTMSREFLEQRAYPYLAAVSTFLEAVTSEHDGEGKRTLPLSSSPEINDNKPDAWFPGLTNYDNALIQWSFAKSAELAALLGKQNDADRWERDLTEMPPLAYTGGTTLSVAPGIPLAESHRHHSNLMAIYPLCLLNYTQGEQEADIIRTNLEQMKKLGTKNWCGYSFAWQAALAAHARDGVVAANALRIFSQAFCLRNSFHCNGDQSGKGYSNFTYRPFTLEGNFAAAAATLEMLLQSNTGVIELFPAIPPDWKEAAFHFLRAEGAFVVSAELKEGALDSAEIIALAEGACKVRVPGSKEIHTQLMKPNDTLRYQDKTFSYLPAATQP